MRCVEAAVAEAEVERAGQAGSRARARAARGHVRECWRARASPRTPTCGSPARDEETLAHEAEPEAAAALRREAVLAAIVEAEKIEPTDEQVREALEPTAERQGTTAEKLFERLSVGGRLDRVRREVPTRQAIEMLVAEAKPISVEQAKARKKIWTPGKETADDTGTRPPSGQLWTPGS